MSKHSAPRFVRTREVLVGLPVVAGVSAVTLGLLAFPAQAHTTTPPPAAAAAPAAVPADQETVERRAAFAALAAAHGGSWRERHERNSDRFDGRADDHSPRQLRFALGMRDGAPAPAPEAAVAPAPAPEAAPAPAPEAAPAPAPAPAPAVAVTAQSPSTVAHITNSSGPVQPRAQVAANSVVTNVPGAAGITIGGTRASAADPNGHPSGLALDYMVMSDAALGDAIVAYHIAHWDQLGVDYVIWQQRILTSPTGSWKPMEDRGSVTANHFDHPHVNYQAG